MKDAAFEKFAAGRSFEEIEAQEVADDADALTPVQEALVEMRARLGMTQPQLAYRLGVNPVTVCRWETVRPPKGIFLYKLADFAREVEDQAVVEVFDKAILYAERGTWRGTVPGNAWNARETRKTAMTRMIQLTQNGKKVAFRVESIAIVAEHWEEYGKTMLARLWIVGARDEDYWQVKETYEEVMAMMQEAAE